MSHTLTLCYHAVSPTWTADLSVRPDAFAAQLRLLHRAGYRGVTFTEAVREPARGKRVAVTFDDAFASVVELAKPVLDGFGWPATIYPVADYADSARPLAWDGVERWAATDHASELASLDWAALRGLAAAGWEVGSHTVTHPRLTQVPDTALARELTESRTRVEAALQRPCTSVAYPYGDCDDRVLEAAAAAGYAAAAALPANWPAAAPLAFPRVGVYHPDDLRRFRLKCSRAVQLARRRLRR